MGHHTSCSDCCIVLWWSYLHWYCTHIRTHSHMHTYVHTDTHTHTRIHTRTYAHTHTHAHTYTHTHTHKHTHTHTHVPTTQDNAQNHLQTCIASRHYHIYTKFANFCGYSRVRSCSFERARVLGAPFVQTISKQNCAR